MVASCTVGCNPEGKLVAVCTVGCNPEGKLVTVCTVGCNPEGKLVAVCTVGCNPEGKLVAVCTVGCNPEGKLVAVCTVACLVGPTLAQQYKGRLNIDPMKLAISVFYTRTCVLLSTLANLIKSLGRQNYFSIFPHKLGIQNNN